MPKQLHRRPSIMMVPAEYANEIRWRARTGEASSGEHAERTLGAKDVD
jgi:hypothetical protein